MAPPFESRQRRRLRIRDNGGDRDNSNERDNRRMTQPPRSPPPRLMTDDEHDEHEEHEEDEEDGENNEHDEDAPPPRPRQRLCTADRVALVQSWYQCNGNMRQILSQWRRNREIRVSGRTVLSTVQRFHESGSVLDRARPGRNRSVRVDEIIGRVRESVRREPMLSTRKRAQRLNMSRSSLMRIQKLDLGVRAYKVQMAHHLLPIDAAARSRLSRRVSREVERDPSFVHRLIMGDEAHFDLSGGVFNRQNVRFWGTMNPRIVRPRMAHSVRVTVWCGVSSSGILGPYFFEDRDERTVSVTGERYREMLRDYVEPLLRLDRRYSRYRPGGACGWWWQQDGATAHTARETMTLLRRIFGANRIISRGSKFSWPPRSPDLSAADYFLWGYLKDRVYGGGGNEGAIPRTVEQLKEAIVREVANLNKPEAEQLRRSVMSNLTVRTSACLRENGGHLRDVIFHT